MNKKPYQNRIRLANSLSLSGTQCSKIAGNNFSGKNPSMRNTQISDRLTGWGEVHVLTNGMKQQSLKTGENKRWLGMKRCTEISVEFFLHETQEPLLTTITIWKTYLLLSLATYIDCGWASKKVSRSLSRSSNVVFNGTVYILSMGNMYNLYNLQKILGKVSPWECVCVSK